VANPLRGGDSDATPEDSDEDTPAVRKPVRKPVPAPAATGDASDESEVEKASNRSPVVDSDVELSEPELGPPRGARLTNVKDIRNARVQRKPAGKPASKPAKQGCGCVVS
jgi:hypothetical protein